MAELIGVGDVMASVAEGTAAGAVPHDTVSVGVTPEPELAHPESWRTLRRVLDSNIDADTLFRVLVCDILNIVRASLHRFFVWCGLRMLLWMQPPPAHRFAPWRNVWSCVPSTGRGRTWCDVAAP